ncbi:MAG: hypothetical protein EAZ44_05450 [Cytophagia bacterium]|nr:MAG: hypothetical protein EAZ44_05450 [Cytophagia bacterium]
MKILESVKNDVFGSFADAQMSKEEMKMVKGGAEDGAPCTQYKVTGVTRMDNGRYKIYFTPVGGGNTIPYDSFYSDVIGRTTCF